MHCQLCNVASLLKTIWFRIIVTTSNDLNLSRGIPDLRAMGSSDNGIGSENRSATEVEVVALSPQTHLPGDTVRNRLLATDNRIPWPGKGKGGSHKSKGKAGKGQHHASCTSSLL